MKYYNKTLEEIYKELNTNENGLTKQSINKLLKEYGNNIIDEAKKKSNLRRFLDQFNDMMIIVLIIVAILMLIYGILYSNDFSDSIIIGIVVLVNALMGFFQEKKAEVTLDSLKKYSKSSCEVKRDGKETIIKSEELVPGDIIILEAGNKIPADARIIEENNLRVDESPLTGESVPINKIAKNIKVNCELQEQKNMVFSGCNVVNGTCIAVVVKTGMNTEIGLIAKSLNTPYEVSTPLQLKMKEISSKLTILVFFIILFMYFYGLVNNYEIMEIIMLCSSLAIAVIPEGLPAVITIALSTGTASLAKKKTIVRQMRAVETLGSTNIICTDKTGTITENKMQIKKVHIEDQKMFNYIAALANETIIDKNKYIGDPTETCLFDYLKTLNVDPIKLREKNERIMEAPFDSERKTMSSINKIDNKNYILVKGSLENLIDKCEYIIENNKKVKLTKKIKKETKLSELEMANDALRVIGFAYKEIKKLPTNVDKVIEEEKDLIFIGFVGIIDPPRHNVKESVEKCFKAGIRPIIITGDSIATASAIAREVGIMKDKSEAITGEELDKYSDEELKEEVKKYNVYARVNPNHKTRIVAAWQANDKVVAMTGDGVNDAPAIKDAHVGIGMGKTGTEVTKSVADVILLDDSFATIVDAVEEGRRIFTNIRNNVVYSLSSNFAELFVIFIGMFTGNIILLPIHILFIDLITDTIPSICLSFEKAERNIMKKPPRRAQKPIFTPFTYSCIIYSAVVETIFALTTYFIALYYYNATTAASLALLSIVIQEIIYAITCRNLKKPIFKQGVLSNKSMNIGIIIVIILELLVFMTPLGGLIDIAVIDFKILLVILLFNLLGVIFYEVSKPILTKLFKD